MWDKLLKNEKLLCFIGGAAVALVGTAALKSDKARNLCVKTLAAGMKLQKDAQETLQNIKEEAADMYLDASQKLEPKK